MSYDRACVSEPRDNDPAKASDADADANAGAVDAADLSTLTAPDVDSHAAAHAAAHAAVGSELKAIGPARYVTRGEHGRGGIGRVLVARDLQLGRDVAVKELLHRGSQAEARFLREALITARLEHPGIVPVHEAGRRSDGTPFYAMKMISGRPLRDLIDSRHDLDGRLNLLPNVLAVADAIAYAHAQRVVHRDLKPSNVIVGAYGETVVIDWGLAKDLRETTTAMDSEASPQRAAGDDSLTVVGQVMGTPSYMPPEQARGDEVDERADVYSIGAMLYHLLVGRAPYTADSSEQILALVKGGDLTPVNVAVPQVPGDLAAIVTKAMAAEPAQRYASGGALADDLRQYMAGNLVGAKHYGRWELMRRWISKHRTIVATTAVFVALAVGGTAWFVAKQQRLREQAQAERDVASAARAESDRHALLLLQRQARSELKAGHPFRAAVLFNEARARGADGFGVRLGLGEAMRQVDRLQVTFRGRDSIDCAAFSPDGARVVVGDRDKNAFVWDAASGALLMTLEGHTSRVETCQYSPDGRRILTASWDGTGRIWNAETGENLATFGGETGEVFEATYSPDGESIASGGAENVVQVRDAHGAGVRELDVSGGGVRSLSFSPDGRLIVVGSRDGAARILDAASGRLVRTLRGHSRAVLDVTFSPDNRFVATASFDGTGGIWDAHTGERLHTLFGHAQILTAAAFSHDGARLVTAGFDGTARVWDPRTGAWLDTIEAHDGAALASASISPDGTKILTSGEDRTARIWRATPEGVLPGHTKEVTIAQFSPDGRWLLTWSHDGTAQLWRADTLELVWRKEGVGGPWTAAFSPDSTRVVVSHFLGPPPRIIRVDSGEVEVELLGHLGAVFGVDFSPDGASVVTAGHDRTVRLWDAATGKQQGPPLVDLAGTDSFRTITARFSPDGTRVVTARGRGRLTVWDPQTRTLVMELAGHGDMVNTAMYSPDGTRILSAGWDDNLAKIWNAQTGELVHTLSGHTGRLFWASFSPDGAIVATAGSDKVARFWDAQTGELLYELAGMMYSADFSPDGTRIAVSGYDGEARVLRLETRSREQIDRILRAKTDWVYRDGILERRAAAAQE